MNKKIVEAILARKYETAKKLIEAEVRERVFASFNEDAQGEPGNDVTTDDGDEKVAKANKYTKSPSDFEDEGPQDDAEYGEAVVTEDELTEEDEEDDNEDDDDEEDKKDESSVTKSYDIDADLAGEDPPDDFEDEGPQDDAEYGETVYTESEDEEEKKDDDKEDDDDDEDKNEAMIVRFKEGYRILDEQGNAIVNKTFKTLSEASQALDKLIEG